MKTFHLHFCVSVCLPEFPFCLLLPYNVIKIVEETTRVRIRIELLIIKEMTVHAVHALTNVTQAVFVVSYFIVRFSKNRHELSE